MIKVRPPDGTFEVVDVRSLEQGSHWHAVDGYLHAGRHVAPGVVDLKRPALLRVRQHPQVVVLHPAEVGQVRARAPEDAVVLDEPAGEEDVRGEDGRVGGEVAERQVVVAALLEQVLERDGDVEKALDEQLGARALPVEAVVDGGHLLVVQAGRGELLERRYLLLGFRVACLINQVEQ